MRGKTMSGKVAAAVFAVCMSACRTCGDALREVDPKSGWDTLLPPVAAAGDWPWWRGPTRDNVAPDNQSPPTAWSDRSNLVWRVKLRGLGHSSPVRVGERIYVSAGEKTKDRAVLWLVGLERATGETVWQAELYAGPIGRQHPDNAPAAATPACDGERLFVPYQNGAAVELAAVNLKGQLIWRKTVAPYNTIQGFSASPALYNSAVIVPVEGPKGCYLTAFHRATGDVVWRRAIRANNESYAPVLVRELAGRVQVLLIGGLSTRGFDPDNGNLLWTCEGPARTCVATPVTDRTTVYATGGYPGRKLLAIRADGNGDVTQTHVVWSGDAKAGYVPTPLLHHGLLYAVNDQGLLRCYDTQDGHVAWQHDFKTPFYSSPVLANGHLYLFDRQGSGFVVPVGRAFGGVVTNTLPSGVFASPVIVDSRIYLRTLGDFYCLGAP